MLAELTAVVDALPPELPGLATHKPKPPAKPTPPPRHLIGTEGSVVYGHFDEDLNCWIYHSIGPAGITPSCSTIHAAKSAYKTLAENQRG